MDDSRAMRTRLIVAVWTVAYGPAIVELWQDGRDGTERLFVGSYGPTRTAEIVKSELKPSEELGVRQMFEWCVGCSLKALWKAYSRSSGDPIGTDKVHWTYLQGRHR